MSGAGSPALHLGGLEGLAVAVVAGSWHEEVMAGLIAGAHRTFDAAGIVDRRERRVPGAFELPLGAQVEIAAGADAVVALGVVVRGGTPHFDYVCRAATDGLVRVGLDHGVPIGFGLLTCDSVDQALDRAGLPGSSEDKGHEAAAAALAMARALRTGG
jgi:6,7-dimethyl-8-ribityllumazine synthase